MTWAYALFSTLSVQQGTTPPLDPLKMDWPATKAERTGFRETSSYADVMTFLKEIQKLGAPIRLEYSGKSPSGKPIPLVIAARPMVNTIAEAKATGKPIVYIQANIHAGEVEGKEASLSLLRRYSQDPKGLLNRVILLIQPIYNIDGNDKFGPSEKNRPGQTGPDIVGERANGQGYDLNRDCVKAESPEMRGVLENIYPWNPDVVMDLHTTNGTRHGYPLTFSGPLHPNTHPLVQNYALNEFLPQVRTEARSKYRLELFDYGNREKDKDGFRWTTFAYEPRYVTNYGGLRNAICILSEAMVYEPFKERVVATERFVDLCLNKIARDGRRIVQNHQKADQQVVEWGLNPEKAPKLAVRAETKLRGVEDVLMERARNDDKKPRSGPIRDIETVKLPVYDRFTATRTEVFPAGYLFKDPTGKAVENLVRHGIVINQLLTPKTLTGEAFLVRQVIKSAGKFQGHNLIRAEGNWSGANLLVDDQWYYVPTAQPLGLLAFDLLEPACLDGLAAWEFFGDIKEGVAHPVARVLKPINVPMVKVKQP